MSTHNICLREEIRKIISLMRSYDIEFLTVCLKFDIGHFMRKRSLFICRK